MDENDIEIQADDNADYLEFLREEALTNAFEADYPDDYQGDDEPQEFTDEELEDMQAEFEAEMDEEIENYDRDIPEDF